MKFDSSFAYSEDISVRQQEKHKRNVDVGIEITLRGVVNELYYRNRHTNLHKRLPQSIAFDFVSLVFDRVRTQLFGDKGVRIHFFGTFRPVHMCFFRGRRKFSKTDKTVRYFWIFNPSIFFKASPMFKKQIQKQRSTDVFAAYFDNTLT